MSLQILQFKRFFPPTMKSEIFKIPHIVHFSYEILVSRMRGLSKERKYPQKIETHISMTLGRKSIQMDKM